MDSATPTFNQRMLSAPSLMQANKFGIGAKAAAHLLATVKPYTAMDQGDLITLFWDGFYVASKVVAAGEVGLPLTLRVPASFVQSGTAQTWYQVQKVGNLPTTSASKNVLVKLECPGGDQTHVQAQENQSLTPVALSGVSPHQGLSAKQLKKGAAMIIDPYENMAARDEITLRWGDMRLDLPKIHEKDVGKPIIFEMPHAMILEAKDDPSLEITYCVIDLVGNNSRWAPATALSSPARALSAPVRALSM